MTLYQAAVLLGALAPQDGRITLTPQQYREMFAARRRAEGTTPCPTDTQ